MYKTILANEVIVGMGLYLGLIQYKVTYVTTREDGKIQFHLLRHNIRSSLVAKPDDELDIETKPE